MLKYSQLGQYLLFSGQKVEKEARFYGAQSVTVSSGEYKINSKYTWERLSVVHFEEVFENT